jgi:hypothetical protein
VHSSGLRGKVREERHNLRHLTRCPYLGAIRSRKRTTQGVVWERKSTTCAIRLCYTLPPGDPEREDQG